MPPCKWRRMFLDAEHSRRNDLRKHRRFEYHAMKTISDQHESIGLLKTEVMRARREIRTQFKLIKSMQQTLTANNLPLQHTIASLRHCPAKDDLEICPLSMAPINQSPPPFKGCAVTVLDPILKPHYKCAELRCGHRFNAVWLMCHFVRNQTFRCPICRDGKRRFHFDSSVIPQELLDGIAKWTRSTARGPI